MANKILNTPGGIGQIPAGNVLVGNGYTGNLATFNGKIFVFDFDIQPDPLNPLNLPPKTIRVRFVQGYVPSNFISEYSSATQVDAENNIWDITTNYDSWSSLFRETYEPNDPHYLLEILGANSKDITDMSDMCLYCNLLQYVPILNTTNVTDVGHMFQYCRNVQYGAYEFYQRLKPQFEGKDSDTYHYCFYQCGINTETGRADLEKIDDDDWK